MKRGYSPLAVILCINLSTILLYRDASSAATTCDPWVAKIVSVQGNVQTRRVDQTQWQPVLLNDTYCTGDRIQVGENSRADIILVNQPVLRLDQNSTITLGGVKEKRTSLIELIKGAVYFFSRFPRTLEINTAFVNGGVERTEGVIRVEADRTLMTIFEGKVLATNKAGSLVLTDGQSAVAEAGQAPALRAVVRPRDAVQWALYYPPVTYSRADEFPAGPRWQGMVRNSIESYRKSDVQAAFEHIKGVPDTLSEPGFFTYRASLLLAVGRADEARQDIERALSLDPAYVDAVALQSIIAVAQNEKGKALDLAKKAVESDPKSASALIALSYAQQANFDLEGARDSLKHAVQSSPDNALAWARLAELHLSFAALDEALDAARKAVAVDPNLSRTRTVLGFAFLTQVETKEAKAAFEKAIEFDQADYLPRLGLGLAKIREGDLQEGRRDIEIAVSLDPNNSLVRSYLGKAYFEEKRTELTDREYAIAKQLDPKDPTPWFYDAIQKQTTNRPVEALHDLQRSIELNNNRAVYRSRLLLDEDLAARSATLARIYDELGFRQRALTEAWQSLNVDPANYSAHRFLSDSYAALPRHEIAQVSELLQSQLLQPISISPVQPQLAESSLFILDNAGPSDPSMNEFNPLFVRNRVALLASGIGGEKETFGDEAVLSGVWGRVSYSLGQFHQETNGFRKNNDLNQDTYNAFVQVSLSPQTSVQAEFRYKDLERGDLPLRFEHSSFLPDLRQDDEIRSIRLGLHYSFAPHSRLIASASYRSADFDSRLSVCIELVGCFPSTAFTDTDGFMGELQHLFRWGRVHLISGVGHFDANRTDKLSLLPFFSGTTEDDEHHTNLYLYSQITFPDTVTWTLGGSADFFKVTTRDKEGGQTVGILKRNQFNPKFGVTWNPFPNTTLRGAVFKVVKRSLLSDQTIEPTQVAGFNQFFDDVNGTESWRYGLGIDQKFSTMLFGGVEFSRRDLDLPFVSVLEPGRFREADWEEDLGRAYLYWTPRAWLAISAEYQYERFRRRAPHGEQVFGEEKIAKAHTHRVPLGISLFHSSGLRARLTTTYVDQVGDFGRFSTNEILHDNDQFWVVDASIGYRLPHRRGLLSVGVKNLFDNRFHFQDSNPRSPTVSPERQVLVRFTLAF